MWTDGELTERVEWGWVCQVNDVRAFAAGGGGCGINGALILAEGRNALSSWEGRASRGSQPAPVAHCNAGLWLVQAGGNAGATPIPYEPLILR